MLYFRLDADRRVTAIRATDEEISELHKLVRAGKEQWLYDADSRRRPEGGWLCRVDIATFEFAELIARKATENAQRASTSGNYQLYIAIDSGPGVSPRYDVIAAPMVGDQVSRGFNGDYYPAGRIVHVSASLRVVTTQGEDGAQIKRKFYRRGQTGRWVQTGGTWSLVPGVHNERNPHI